MLGGKTKERCDTLTVSFFFEKSRKKDFAIVEERADESASLPADSFRPAHPGRSEILNYDLSKIKCFHLKVVGKQFYISLKDMCLVI